MHTPSESVEKCHTCRKEFESYWHLMNHRRTEHPSKRKCRYFLKNNCNFDGDTCWYRHEFESKVDEEKQTPNFPCNECDHAFEHRSDLMKHKKTFHPDKVSKCREFLLGKCNSDENNCWFAHKTEQRESEKMETDEETNKQVFHQDQEKTPPDQMKNILLMLNKLSFQVEQLEKISMKTQ